VRIIIPSAKPVQLVAFVPSKKYTYVLGIRDLFGTELAMIFSFHVGLTDSVMQRMQFFFLSVSVRHFLVIALPDLIFVTNYIIIQNKWHRGRRWKFKFMLAARPLLIIP
jgi:hypothetical protein